MCIPETELVARSDVLRNEVLVVDVDTLGEVCGESEKEPQVVTKDTHYLGCSSRHPLAKSG